MTERMPLMAANWKMHKTIRECVAFVEALHRETGSPRDREVLIAPPFTALFAIRDAMRAAGFLLAGQNCHWEEKGAFTGEIAPSMLLDAGCTHVILGHSERRHLMGETDEMVGKKVRAAWERELVPIVCVGEKLDEREAGGTFEVVTRQLKAALDGVSAERARRTVLAYEPVWAIGNGKTATPEQAQEVHALVREQCASLYDKTVANGIRILYGGSVKPGNVDALMACADIDGTLVGGAGLEVDSFQRIVRYQA